MLRLDLGIVGGGFMAARLVGVVLLFLIWLAVDPQNLQFIRVGNHRRQA